MIEHIVCPKCRKLNSHPTGSPSEACPFCGVIYSKAKLDPTRKSTSVNSGAPASASASGNFFLDQLRSESAYPAFRTVISFTTVVGYILAIMAFAGGSVATMRGAGFGPFVGGCIGAAILFIATRVFKEMWLMLADLTDATIRIARGQNTR